MSDMLPADLGFDTTGLPMMLAADRPFYEAGAAIAEARCGPWPLSGALSDFADACDRARREADHVNTLERRWTMRYRVWLADRFERALPQAYRLRGRRERSREIAASREQLLAALIRDVAGRA